jgi:mediator of RNA polymerase II transcription subunit 14
MRNFYRAGKRRSPLPSTVLLTHALFAEFIKFGVKVRGLLYIQLTPFPSHFLLLVVTDTDFRYALISVKIVPDSMFQSLIMEDIGWLDVERICGRGREARALKVAREEVFGGPSAGSSRCVVTFRRNASVG